MIWLKDNWRSLLWMVTVIVIAITATEANRYRNKYKEAQSIAESRLETINDMQRRQKSVAALDEKYTKELADAKATIDQLHDDVANGKRRLRLNASCEKQSSSASSMDDAASPRLTDSAQRDYFTLRDRIETASKQIAGLQEYIRTQCLN